MESNALTLSGKAKSKIIPKIIQIGTMDYTILFVTLILVLLGTVMVYSASYLTAGTSQKWNYDSFLFLRKHAIFAGIGFCVMMIMANLNYKYLRRFAFLIYIISNILLVLVFFIGITTKGATRWIPLPIIGQFQPSEVAKVGIIFFVSFLISMKRNILLTWPGFLLCCGAVGITALLVALGNLSTAIIIVLIGIGIIFIACPYIWRFVIAGASGAGLMVAFLALSSSSDNFRAGRFDAWLNPFDYPTGYGYQVVQSLYAIASGGMFGLGIGQSRQKTFLPEAHNDIIFSIICEELGFVGAALVILLFGILIWKGIQVAINAPDTFSSLTATGIILLIASQALINIAVVTNSIPNTGVPLPLISYGGTALIIMMAMIGVLLNISRCTKKRS